MSGDLVNETISASERFQSATGDFISDITQVSSETSSPQSFIDKYGILRIVNIMLILVILSILGMNILGYTEKVIETIVGVIEPVFKYFGYSIINLTDTTLEKSRQGTKFTTDAVADSTEAVLSDVSDFLDLPEPSSEKQGQGIKYNKYYSSGAQQDDSTSEIQRESSLKGKAGYCYIGTDRGVRSCVKVGHYDRCMSGEVFPRMDICINPKLRT